ncbi:hypothetical protein ACTMTP_10340 [Klebsiella pneumoniae]|uniref:hypothetical protein n=1 Tax=Klebsiella pneumoniae TaxID=573 RepID=UPI003F8CA3E6
MNKVELLEKISALATECHTLAYELDIGDERTEMFEIYSVLHNLCRRGYANQVEVTDESLCSPSCDDEEDEEGDDWDEDDD